MKNLQWVILTLSGLTLVVALSSLMFPLEQVFRGDANISSALTTAMALTVASLGVVLAVYMQSAEYRRSTEIIDGIQELRIILELMMGRWATMAGNQMLDQSTLSLEKEKEKLLEVLIGPAGRFLSLYRSEKDIAAGEKGEMWRALPIHLASIMEAISIKDCIDEVAKLHTLIEALDSKHIKSTAKLVVSKKSLELLKEDILVIAAKSVLNSKSEGPEISKTEIERLYNELAEKLNETEKDNKSWLALDDTFEKAMQGDNEAALAIASLHKAIVV